MIVSSRTTVLALLISANGSKDWISRLEYPSTNRVTNLNSFLLIAFLVLKNLQVCGHWRQVDFLSIDPARIDACLVTLSFLKLTFCAGPKALHISTGTAGKKEALHRPAVWGVLQLSCGARLSCSCNLVPLSDTQSWVIRLCWTPFGAGRIGSSYSAF